MEVKDIPKPAGKSEGSSPVKQARPPLQRSAVDSLRSVSPTSVNAVRSEPVALEVEPRSKSAKSNEARDAVNRAISSVNSAADGIAEIEKLVESIDGIVEQASSENTSAERREALEREANELVGEIRRRAQAVRTEEPPPPSGDKVRGEIEEKIGKTLRFILPEDASEAFGLKDITFPSTESILRTRAEVERVRQRVEELRESIKETQSEVVKTVDSLEVALQNNEAAASSVRDLDEALQLVGNTSSKIGENREAALGSIGNLRFNRGIADLLKN